MMIMTPICERVFGTADDIEHIKIAPETMEKLYKIILLYMYFDFKLVASSVCKRCLYV